MKGTIILALFIVLISCKKEKELPLDPPARFEDFIGKYLVCDSIILNVAGSLVHEIRGKGKGLDMTIKADSTITVYSSANNTTKQYYELHKPDTLFFSFDRWMRPDAYMIVSMPSKKQFRMYQPVGDRFREYYFTVE